MTKQEKNIALTKWEGFDPYWNCIIHGEVSADRIVAAANGPTCPWCGSTLDLRECADYFEQAEPLRRLRNRLDKEQKEKLINHILLSSSHNIKDVHDYWDLLDTPNDMQIEIIGCQILKLW